MNYRSLVVSGRSIQSNFPGLVGLLRLSYHKQVYEPFYGVVCSVRTSPSFSHNRSDSNRNRIKRRKKVCMNYIVLVFKYCLFYVMDILRMSFIGEVLMFTPFSTRALSNALFSLLKISTSALISSNPLSTGTSSSTNFSAPPARRLLITCRTFNKSHLTS